MKIISNDRWDSYRVPDKKEYNATEVAYILNNPEHMPRILKQSISVDCLKKLLGERFDELFHETNWFNT